MLNIETGKQNETLRAVSKPIKTNEIKNYLKLGKEMLKYIKNSDNGGVGLAAPQVGYTKRLIVVSLLRKVGKTHQKSYKSQFVRFFLYFF